LYNGARETVADMGTSSRVSFKLLIPQGSLCRNLSLISHLAKESHFVAKGGNQTV